LRTGEVLPFSERLGVEAVVEEHVRYANDVNYAEGYYFDGYYFEIFFAAVVSLHD
jgi:hypothetical protein